MKKSKRAKRQSTKRKASKGPKLGFIGAIWKKIRSI
jgi:hypothetical protein